MTNRAERDRDYYALLGVGRGADDEEIRRAFRALARRLHPDVNRAPDAAERFATVVRAYDTLSDADRRRAYDRARQPREGARGGAFGGPTTTPRDGESRGGSGSPTGAGPYGMPAGQVRPDMPSTPASRGPRRGEDSAPPRSALRGLDVHYTLHLSLEEAARGTSKEVLVPRREICILCGGMGAAPGGVSRPCTTCHGSGRARSGGGPCLTCGGSGSLVDLPCTGCAGSGRRAGLFELGPLRFPAGLPSVGYTKRIKGEGDPGPRGGPRGELLVHVRVDDSAAFQRVAPDSADVRSDLHLSAEQAQRGGRIQVPTLSGGASLRLPPGVASGATFILRGKGLRRPGQFGRGNHHVTLHVS